MPSHLHPHQPDFPEGKIVAEFLFDRGQKSVLMGTERRTDRLDTIGCRHEAAEVDRWVGLADFLKVAEYRVYGETPLAGDLADGVVFREQSLSFAKTCAERLAGR